MKALLVGTVGVGLMLGSVVGIGAAAAQTANGSVELVSDTGNSAGTASEAVNGLGMNVTVTLQGEQPNASYSVCATSPYPGQITGECPVAVPYAVAGAMVQPANDVTVTTDASGDATVTLMLPVAMPVTTIDVMNDANPSDTAQATLTSDSQGINVTGGF